SARPNRSLRLRVRLSPARLHLAFELVSAEPDWLLRVNDFHRDQERSVEALLTVANGYAGTRGALDKGSPASLPLTLFAGVFDPAHGSPEPPTTAEQSPAVLAPDWTRLRMQVQGETPFQAVESLRISRRLQGVCLCVGA